mmetsp:Transcript_15221/g.19285  ORF Transcript_15221/g.19285 Transcript_15221/m.19285 type:complete len:105 (-) Transcript_15221:3134-3448(-)
MFSPTQALKQFDSDPTLATTRPNKQQQKSANELATMKNDNSELIVRKKCLIGQAAALSTEQIIHKADRASHAAENENPNVAVVSKKTADEAIVAKSERRQRRAN